MNAAKETIFGYWTRWAPNFDAAASHVRYRTAWQEVLAAAVPCPPRRACLDLGTGTGACALTLAAIGHDVTGLDGAPGMLAEARRAAGEQGLDIAFREGDVDATPFADASFDVISARNLFWTLPDPDRTMREITRLLRPGGVFLFSDGLWRTDTVAPEASSHDMTDYVQVSDELPYYRGLLGEQADALLDFHGFTGRTHWEQRFTTHLYAHQAVGACPFFVVTARRPLA
ncbi:MAG: class I SAM-dependent methyltransferase [Alphaproteobacteria bacterium]|nr:class I SAM-dependent methyltransferase [Alphaproteobacteria bacterium]